MARPPRLGGVVADLSSVLMAVQRLHGHIAIEDPVGTERLPGALGQRLVHPLRAAGQLGFTAQTLRLRIARARCGRQMRQGPAQALVADDLLHAQDLRCHRVTAQARHMSVTPLTVQDGEQPGAQHIPGRRGIRAGVSHRAARHPALEQPRDLQKLGKEGQLTQRRRTPALVPAHLKAPTGGADAHLRRYRGELCQRSMDRFDQCLRLKFRFTHWVILLSSVKPTPALSLTQFRTAQLRKIGSIPHARSAANPAAAHCSSSSTLPPDTPMAPITSPSTSTGIPPPNTTRRGRWRMLCWTRGG
jgi:hypothetical protein